MGWAALGGCGPVPLTSASLTKGLCQLYAPANKLCGHKFHYDIAFTAGGTARLQFPENLTQLQLRGR